MNNLHIKKISNDVAKTIIVDNHYTHKWTICSLALGIFDKTITDDFIDEPKLLGVIVFGPTAGGNVSKSVSSLLTTSNLWELKRLWVDDVLGKNTESWFISQSIKYIKQNHTEIKCLISYADPDAGHIGIIYQATNWLYQNIERPKGTSGYVVSFDGGQKWAHGRTLFNKYGSFEFKKLVAVLPRPFWIKELSVKQRYIYPLGNHKEKNALIKSFNYPIIDYPKTKNDKEIIKKYD